MKKKQKIVLAVLVAAVLVAGIAYYLAVQHTNTTGGHSDACTATDRAQNNCAPAGRCTPPGDPREATVDCDIKNYDHKFSP